MVIEANSKAVNDLKEVESDTIVRAAGFFDL